jgi:tRNA dimethylallyltransferase
MQMKKQPLVAIVGPTAVGKTDLSISLAKRFNGEIISGDSMQVYRGMDIGTAKITRQEMQGVPHHLIDIIDPDQAYNALQFQTMARQAILEIASRGHLPIVVGGTGLYINSLLYDYGFKGNTDDAYRKSLESMTTEELYRHLIAERPDLTDQIKANDRFRIIRALEIMKTSGKASVRAFDMPKNYQSPYDLCLIGLNMDRQRLYDRIDHRVDRMLEAGLVGELEILLSKGYNDKMQALQAIGYKEVIPFLKGECSLEEAVALLKKNTRHFAKRQITWFKRDPNIRWFYTDEVSAGELLESCSQYIEQTLHQ